MKKLLTILFVIVGYIAVAQNPNVVKYASTITADELKQRLTIFASDEYEGRNTGSAGMEKAVNYLTDFFKQEKLNGPVTGTDNPYLQKMNLTKITRTVSTIECNGKTYTNLKDFAILDAPDETTEKDVVFVGYGIQGKEYSDLKDVDLSGKIVAFCVGEPKTKKGIYLTNGTDKPEFSEYTGIENLNTHVMGRIQSYFQKGAVGCMIIDTDEKRTEAAFKLIASSMGDSRMVLEGTKIQSNPYSFFFMPLPTAKALLNLNDKQYAKMVKGITEKKQSPSGKYNFKIKIKNETKTETVVSQNILGVLEGTDLKDEYIVVSAHYDHVGVTNGVVYNGADDNGSGSMALTELAQAFRAAANGGFTSRRSIVFIAYTGEEKGLLGSNYYAEHPIFPIEKTYANINIDMIGRIDKEHSNGMYLYSIGADYISKDLRKVSEMADSLYSPNLKLDYAYNDPNHPEHLYYRSDHYPLAAKGVPSVFYNSGLHDDYHQPTDDVEKIAFPEYEQRTRLMFATIWELANRKEPLAKN